MKVIDVLNKMAKGEVISIVDEKGYFVSIRKLINNLNSEVEIIKENKNIEKLDTNTAYFSGTHEILWNDTEMYIVDKINEIIDRLNGESDE